MDNPDIVVWYFDRYVDIFQAIGERPLNELMREGIDKETIYGLYLGIVQLGFRIKWRLSFLATPEERNGKKAVLARIFLYQGKESEIAPKRTREVKLFFPPDSYERLKREALRNEHREKEGGLLPPYENERFIASLGINPPPQ